MTTTTILVTGGATWTPPGDSVGTNAKIVCFGAGEGEVNTGGSNYRGGNSGGISVLNSFAIPSTTPISIQIPAANSASQCWFNSSATIAANSGATANPPNTTGAVGDLKRAGSQGGPSTAGPTRGGGGGGTPSETAAGQDGNTLGPGFGGDSGSGAAGGSTFNNGANGTEYAITAGGTAGAGAGGGAGVDLGCCIILPGGNGGLYGGGAGGTDTGSAGFGGTPAPGAIIISYTPSSGGTALTGSGVLSGIASLSASASHTPVGSATLAGQASLFANVSFFLIGVFATLPGQGNFIANAIHAPLGGAVLVGIANAIANATQLVALAADQAHYRFRTDSGAVDGTPTWAAAQDTPWSTTP